MQDHELYLLLGRIDGKLDAALQRQERSEAVLEALDKRVSSMERSRAYLWGAAAVAGAVAATLKSFVFAAVGLG